MKRYNTSNRLSSITGRKYYPTVKYPVIEEKLSDIYIIGSFSDRLDNLAWQYYKDPTLWWIIAEANSIGKGSLLVPIGKQIRIPTEITTILQEYTVLNNLQQ
jgi:hypothetical protein